MKQIRRLRWYHYFLGSQLFFVVLVMVTNVPTRLNTEDVLAVQAILGVQVRPEVLSFDDEIRTIRWAQAQVLRVAPGMEPIPDYFDREPMDLLRNQSGLCYDRSRAIDKVLNWLGFETRHVYILFADSADSTGVLDFIKQALSYSNSHAVTEVKTSRGWMLVGSNTAWVSLNKEGEPVPADAIHRRRSEFVNPPAYVNVPLWAIRGLYSRRGQLYKPFIPFPEFNWIDFTQWLLELD